LFIIIPLLICSHLEGREGVGRDKGEVKEGIASYPGSFTEVRSSVEEPGYEARKRRRGGGEEGKEGRKEKREVEYYQKKMPCLITLNVKFS